MSAAQLVIEALADETADLRRSLALYREMLNVALEQNRALREKLRRRDDTYPAVRD